MDRATRLMRRLGIVLAATVVAIAVGVGLGPDGTGWDLSLPVPERGRDGWIDGNSSRWHRLHSRLRSPARQAATRI
jgi:hypothetical protein